MADDIAIKVSHLHKEFILPQHKNTTIKQAVVNITRKNGKTRQTVLRDISFEVKKGEFFGIVGRNGSGKSTLLKLLAGIYSPDKGEVHVNGRLTPFIELGVGFNVELSGRDNVFLNGALLGFTHKEMEAMYDDIVEFAELESFMDQKLKNYSSGMQVRLAFSIAIRAQGDILILDEVLAVGDEAFQRKCYQYFAELRRQKTTVILVTHNMDAVQQFCSRAMLIDKGHKTEIGSPLEISQIYRELNDEEGITVNKEKDKIDEGTKYIDASVGVRKHDGKIELDITIKPKREIEEPIVGIEIFKDGSEQVVRWASDEKIDKPINIRSNKNFGLKLILEDIFPVGIFSVRLSVKRRDRTANYGIFNDIATFEIKNKSHYEYDVFWKPNEKFVLKNSDE